MDVALVYTGAASLGTARSGWKGPAAWAALIRDADGERIITGQNSQATVREMELMAAVRSLESVRPSLNLMLITDSAYVLGGISSWLARWRRNGWLTVLLRPVKYRELWERLDFQRRRHVVRCYWGPECAFDRGKRMADAAAQIEANKCANSERESPELSRTSSTHAESGHIGSLRGGKMMGKIWRFLTGRRSKGGENGE